MSLGIILFANGLAWVIFILVFRIVHKRTVRPKKLLMEIESELDSLLVEMNGTTDRNIRLIEESIRRLKDEVATADKRIRILQGEIQKRAESSRTDYLHLARHKPLNIEVIDDNVKKKDESPSLPEKEKEKVSKLKTGISRENSRAAGIKEEILELNRKGIDAKIIAGKVGRPLGEVELIISLSEKTDR